MKNLTRAAATALSVGALGLAMPVAANASSDSVSSSALTCYVQAKKPFIVGGTGTTAKGVGTVRCDGGGTTVRLSVSLQKKVNGIWRQQGYPTNCQGFVGSTAKQCADTNRASSGYWRTKVVAKLVNSGVTRTFFSGQVQFVPARHGFTA